MRERVSGGEMATWTRATAEDLWRPPRGVRLSLLGLFFRAMLPQQIDEIPVAISDCSL